MPEEQYEGGKAWMMSSAALKRKQLLDSGYSLKMVETRLGRGCKWNAKLHTEELCAYVQIWKGDFHFDSQVETWWVLDSLIVTIYLSFIPLKMNMWIFLL